MDGKLVGYSWLQLMNDKLSLPFRFVFVTQNWPIHPACEMTVVICKTDFNQVVKSGIVLLEKD
jgi:hypothetical protein